MAHDATIGIVVEERHLGQAALVEARAALEAAGCDVPVVVPGAGILHALTPEAPAWDGVLSRGRDLSGLALLAALAARGVVAVNAPEAVERSRNKIAMHALLLRHRLPVAATWFASDPVVFARIPRSYFPLVVKPYDGDGSRGLWLLERPDDVRLLDSARGVLMAQELLETGGSDLKLYGIGRRVWAVRKPSPVAFECAGAATMGAVDGIAEAVPLDDRLRDLALTCGRALGLGLWGVDVALTPRGPVAIEVNDFPTYSAVEGAGAEIARYVLGRVELELLVRRAGRRHASELLRSGA